MKKILSAIVLGTLLAALVVPAVSSAQIPTMCNTDKVKTRMTTECNACGDACNVETPPADCDCGVCCLFNMIYNVTDWIFYILMIVAVLMIIFGGFTYITAAGDPEKAGKGKQILTLSIIGIALALIAKIVPSVVRFFMGM